MSSSTASIRYHIILYIVYYRGQLPVKCTISNHIHILYIVFIFVTDHANERQKIEAINADIERIEDGKHVHQKSGDETYVSS